MALAILGFAVAETLPLVGHRSESFGEDSEFCHLQRGFAFAGSEGFSTYSDPVAHI